MSMDFKDLDTSTRLRTGKETLTRQSEKAAADINNIVKRFTQTGALPPVNRSPGMFLDVSDVGDYQECLQRVEKVQDMFEQVPAKVRALFGHDAAKFLEFVNDPRNKDQMIELGLLKREDAAKDPKVDEVAGPGVQHRGEDGRFKSPNVEPPKAAS